MTISDINSFNLPDRYAGLEIEKIFPISERVTSLIIRSKKSAVLQHGFNNVFGAAQMLRAIDYHYSNFMFHFLLLGIDDRAQDKLDNEAVAYINRVGQFHTFSKSELVIHYVPESPTFIPRLSELIIFRNKHTAHRALDAPRKDDNENSLLYYGGCVGLSHGTMWKLRPNRKSEWIKEWLEKRNHLASEDELTREQVKHSYLSYQTINTHDGKPVYFTMECDHDEVMKQANALICRLLAAR